MKVGKTTLIKGLIKHYTRQDVREVKGPITLIAGKARRLTFVECPQDLSAMIDAGAGGPGWLGVPCTDSCRLPRAAVLPCCRAACCLQSAAAAG